MELLNGYLNLLDSPLLTYSKQEVSALTYDLSLINATGVDLDVVLQGVKNVGSIRMMLFGEPGTGKTAFAKHLATKLDKSLLVRKASDLLGKYVGETEKNIAEAFALAEHNDAVLLVDEFDSFMSSREHHTVSWETTMVNEMLTQMEDFKGVFITTTNFKNKMDKAVARRFDFKVELNYLKPNQIMTLIRQILPGTREASCHSIINLKVLTPGDFTVAVRKCALINDFTLEKICQFLREECQYKQGEVKTIGVIPETI
jgi:SpoVK/Ycf46/Vps4 family AAA+-type ATPase